jgi:lipopolysaccharide/colanic/teichoic acid biosynthesis glycosyltransferase
MNETFYSRFGKRWLDLVLACAGLLALLPVLALVSLQVRVKLGRPVLFRQQRPGRGGSLFELVKFRTMTEQHDEQGCRLPDEARLTPFGKLLRSSSLDELPELWNVVRGEMSLVGPRPLLPQYLMLYTPEQSRRHDVRPGITGWAQVNGRNRADWEQRLEMDIWYARNCSLLLDLRILWLTIATVVGRSGVNAEGHVTMPAFTGSRNNVPAVSRTPHESEERPQRAA